MPSLGVRCLWCGEPIRSGSRRDSLYCGQGHRQAAWRFNSGAKSAVGVSDRGATERVTPGGRYAYADPPYPGLARRYYSNHPDFAGEVDHGDLVNRLSAEYDGWALSTSARRLQEVLAVCPGDVRVAAWIRGARHGSSYSPLSSWEPVIYRGARRALSPRSSRRMDSLDYVARPRLADSRRVVGSKPAAFCSWLFTLLGLVPDDLVVDVFPGSGRVAEAWQTYRFETLRLSRLAIARDDVSRDLVQLNL